MALTVPAFPGVANGWGETLRDPLGVVVELSGLRAVGGSEIWVGQTTMQWRNFQWVKNGGEKNGENPYQITFIYCNY